MSLDAQRAKIESYAQLFDLDLLEVVVDAGVSAKTMVRPGLTRALGMLESRTAEALLVAKLDRLTRSVRDLGTLVEQHFAPGGAALLSVSEQIDTRSAAGRLVLNLLGSVSQWERETVSERTSAAMQHMVQSGLYVGGAPPFGYVLTSSGQLIRAESEQAAIEHARSLHASGLSLRAIAQRLSELGHRSRSGSIFLPTQISRMLARKGPEA